MFRGVHKFLVSIVMVYVVAGGDTYFRTGYLVFVLYWRLCEVVGHTWWVVRGV